MPKRNFVIGIGGTGSRVIESMLFLCASGYGPDELSIIIVDPDKGNGNLDRTIKLINEYKACRKKIKRLHELSNLPLFRTEIITAESPVWGIFEGELAEKPETTTLSYILDYPRLKDSNPPAASLVDLLFTKDELETKLTEGFRGHPSIGAVTMAQPPSPDSAWKILYQAIKDSNSQTNDIAVFLVGSIFGGTGAAGVPTFANPTMIKEHPDAKTRDKQSKVVLGGALVLPYFEFESNTEKESKEKVFVKTEDFKLATKAALRYYSEKKLAYDELYLIGDSLNQVTGKFATGKSEQRNNPHYIEIVTALAAFDFFETNKHRANNGSIKPAYFIAGRRGDRISWADFPATRNASPSNKNNDDFKRHLVTMTVLSYSYSSYGMFVLHNPKNPEASIAWYVDNFKLSKSENNTDKDPRSEVNKKLLEQFSDFFLKFINWINWISKPDNVDLINTDNLVTIDETTGKVSLPDWNLHRGKIGSLLKEKSEQLQMQNYVAIYLNNSDKKLPEIANKDQKDVVGVFLELFYRGALAFTAKNYSVDKIDVRI